MDKIIYLIFPLLLVGCSEKPKDIDKISYYKGVLIGKELNEDPEFSYNLKEVIRGIQTVKPEFSEDEYRFSLQKIRKQKSDEILKRTEKTLQALSKDSEVRELIFGKLYFKKLKEGGGNVLKPGTIPLMTFSSKYLDSEEKIVVLHEEETPIPISYEDTIDGFAKGVIGMKEGESRMIYIHPELAFGKGNDDHSLIMIEVKLHSINQKES